MAKKLLAEISARHLHLSAEHLAVLFGEGAVLTPKKDLSQPGQYACVERVDIVGPKRTLAGVSVLGPTRPATQVELSATDARSIGLPICIRESGDLEGTPGCKLVGPKGEVVIDKGVIVAKRHIHTTPEDAAELGVADKQIVSIKIDTPERSTVFGDVVVRVSSKFSSVVHLDTDEANAAGVFGEAYAEIVK